MHVQLLLVHNRLKMKVVPVPVLSDNYAYLLIDDATKYTAVVDPYDVAKVEAALEREGVPIGRVNVILTTHHHNDHAGGNKEFVSLSSMPQIDVVSYPDVQIRDMNLLVCAGLLSTATHRSRSTPG